MLLVYKGFVDLEDTSTISNVINGYWRGTISNQKVPNFRRQSTKNVNDFAYSQQNVQTSENNIFFVMNIFPSTRKNISNKISFLSKFWKNILLQTVSNLCQRYLIEHFRLCNSN